MLHFGLRKMCSEMGFPALTSEQFHIWFSCSRSHLQHVPPWFSDREHG